MKSISPVLTRWIAAPMFLSAIFILLAPISLAAQTQPDSAAKRRVLQQSAPVYPSLARGMALAGIVRVDAVVGPDGIVKSVSIKGGHPVLAQAAVPVDDDDDETSLHERIKVAERALLVDAVGRMAREGWSVNGDRKVRIGT